MLVSNSLFISAVQIILMTDLLALVIERDQKYNLATLQDLKVNVFYI